MKRNLFVLLVALSLAVPALAQMNVLDGVYVKEHTITRAPMIYPYLRENRAKVTGGSP